MSTASPPPSSAGTNSAKENSAQKPPTKPRTRSNYHLESNPFEVSFSQPHTSPTIPAFAPPSPRIRPTSRDGHENKPKLPPIAAMASPGDFGWSFGSGATADVNSLRSGPLSPAMLAGPAQYSSSSANPNGTSGAHHGITNGAGSGFDVMRTGLTPDVNRTGLTPLIGGPTSFPPPSPNTAAFLAMVTHQNNPAGGAPGVAPPGTITPGTFSAITGALLNGSNGDSGTTTSPNGTHHPHPLSVSHVPNGNNDVGVDDAAHTAANGLFLLSQAHHELTKREEQQQMPPQRSNQQAPQSTRAGTNNNTSKGRSNSSATAPLASKRKNTTMEAASAPANKRSRGGNARANNNGRSGGGGRRKKSEDVSSNGEEDDDQDDMMMDMDGGSDEEELEAAARVGTMSSGKGQGNKKPETEEEKRKNFLERNRQAALKCRQRKKQWLNQLQAKVEYLQAENERLQGTTVSMREEISRLSAVVVAHRDCGLGGVSVARSEQLLAGTANIVAPNRNGSSNAGVSSNGGGVSSNVGGGAGALSDGGNGGSGVPSNAPPGANSNGNGNATVNGNGNGNAGGMSTRGRRSAAASAASQSPVPPPQLVAVGGKSGRYGAY